jgi:hypothetical protein
MDATPRFNQFTPPEGVSSPKRSFLERIRHRYNKQHADHYVIRGTLQSEYYREHDLFDALNSDEGRELHDSIVSLKAAKRAYTRDEIGSAELTHARNRVKYAIRSLHNIGDDHRMRFTEWMQDFIIPQFANNVQSLVYGGAGILVMIVGLRGLGDLRSVGFVPNILLDTDGMLQSWIVFVGLCLELAMLLLLAVLFFFTPDEWRYAKTTKERVKEKDITPIEDGSRKKDGLTKDALQALVERKIEEIRMIERIKNML